MAWKNLKNAKQTTAQHFANPKNSPPDKLKTDI